MPRPHATYHRSLVSPPLKNLNSFLARSNRAFETKIRVIWVALFLPTLSLQIEEEISLSLSFLKNRWYFALQGIISPLRIIFFSEGTRTIRFKRGNG